VDPSKWDVVSCVAEISLNVEWFFNTEAVVLHKMPLLDLLWYQSALTDRYNVFVKVNVVGVPTEKVEEKLADTLLVGLSKPTQRADVIRKWREFTVRINQLLMGSLMETRQNRGTSGLQKVDDQANPGVGTKCTAES